MGDETAPTLFADVTQVFIDLGAACDEKSYAAFDRILTRLHDAEAERQEVARMAADYACAEIGVGATPDDWIAEARRRLKAAEEAVQR